MLGFWRKRKSVAVHLVFWPIIAVFVIWGFERYGNPVGGAAAVVNDHTVTLSEYKNAVQRMVDFYNQIFQGNFDEKAQEQYHVKETALNQLIDTELVSEQAEVMGLRPTDAEVRDTLIADPSFVKDGQFSRDQYDMALKYYHLTPSQFESQERSGLVISRVSRLFETNLKPSRLQVEKEKALRSVKNDVEFLKFDKSALIENLKVSQAEIDGFLKDAGHQKEVKEFYDLHSADFSKPDQVKARHILISSPKGDAKAEQAALEKIHKIQGELKTKSFAELAKKYSDDPGSKTKGGDLGWFSKGRMVPEFEKAAFALEVGKTSEPVKTDYGYHIIKVEGKQAAKTTTFEEARNDIAKKMIAKQNVDKALTLADQKLSASPDEAVKIVEGLDKNLKWDETGFFTSADESIPKLGGSAELAAAASGVNKELPFYPRIVTDGNTNYIFKFKKSEPTEALTDEKIIADLSAQTSRNVLSAWRNTLRARANIKVNPQLESQETGDSGD